MARFLARRRCLRRSARSVIVERSTSGLRRPMRGSFFCRACVSALSGVYSSELASPPLLGVQLDVAAEFCNIEMRIAVQKQLRSVL